MKNFLLTSIIFFLFQISLSAQTGYIDINDEIYPFLDRMHNIGIINDYNSFELPKTRKSIRNYLIKIIENAEKLDKIDRNKLSDFIIEFEYDLIATGFFSDELFRGSGLEHFGSDKEKFLYKSFDDEGNSIFINFIGKTDYLNLSKGGYNNNSLLYRFGGEARGSVFEDIGFGIFTTNGSFFGNKSIAQNYSYLRYNYKFNEENEDNSGDNYFDETSAFLTYQNNFSEFKIGNDRILIGHGPDKIIFGDNAPRMDYINFKVNYRSINFSYYHGKLLGNQYISYDSLQGEMNNVSDKFVAYHRLGLNLSRHFNFGIGELVIYANRNIDLAYLNPLAFYKSQEHANQDRDNTLLFLDVQNNSIDGLKLYSTILIDDIDFSKLGTGWYGNKSVLSFGVESNLLYSYLPLDIEVQYIKIDPYVYTHRFIDNSFTNRGYNLASDLMPNSSNTNLFFYYRPHHRINMKLGFKYSLHGTNIFSEDGELLINYGGEIENGHRPFDSEEIYFLGGLREIYREFELQTIFEPVKNWHLTISMEYFLNSLSGSETDKEFFTTFSISAKL